MTDFQSFSKGIKGVGFLSNERKQSNQNPNPCHTKVLQKTEVSQSTAFLENLQTQIEIFRYIYMTKSF